MSANAWTARRLTGGTEDSRFHAHAYYDIPVFDASSRYVVGHEVRFTGRPPQADDALAIGIIDLDGEGGFTPVGESRAWSWQQGALSQWVGHDNAIVWNDRDGDELVARLYDVASGRTRTLPRTVYAIDPTARFALSVDMRRLDTVRPGYGYAGADVGKIAARPADDGVWSVDLVTGETRLLLSTRRAVDFLLTKLSLKQQLRHGWRRFLYWFNHVKIAPDGRRFTVKLRYRARDLSRGWTERMGVSLTCGTDGADLRLLADATSHVIWLDAEQLYAWRQDGVYLWRDTPNGGQRIGAIGAAVIDRNPHIRHLPLEPHRFVFDTPYREDVGLYLLDGESGTHAPIAQFTGHRPPTGPYRCDLHPVPSPNGRRIVVTSPQDGGRQIYLVER